MKVINNEKYKFTFKSMKEYYEYRLKILYDLTDESKNLINLEFALLTLELTVLGGILYNEITNQLLTRFISIISLILYLLIIIMTIMSIYISNRSKNINDYQAPLSEDSLYILHYENINIIDVINISVDEYVDVIKENDILINIKKRYNNNSTLLMMFSLLLFLIIMIILIINLNKGVGLNV